jgi:hypothetical protein
MDQNAFDDFDILAEAATAATNVSRSSHEPTTSDLSGSKRSRRRRRTTTSANNSKISMSSTSAAPWVRDARVEEAEKKEDRRKMLRAAIRNKRNARTARHVLETREEKVQVDGGVGDKVSDVLKTVDPALLQQIAAKMGGKSVSKRQIMRQMGDRGMAEVAAMAQAQPSNQ